MRGVDDNPRGIAERIGNRACAGAGNQQRTERALQRVLDAINLIMIIGKQHMTAVIVEAGTGSKTVLVGLAITIVGNTGLRRALDAVVLGVEHEVDHTADCV